MWLRTHMQVVGWSKDNGAGVWLQEMMCGFGRMLGFVGSWWESEDWEYSGMVWIEWVVCMLLQ